MTRKNKKYAVYAKKIIYYKRQAMGRSEEEVKSKMDRLKTKDTYDIIDTEFFISEILQEE
jgi:hypothetical protein